MSGTQIKSLPNSGLAKHLSDYDFQQKSKLVALGNGPKPYKEILSHLQSEIELSTKMTDFSYKVKCFRDDGVYQLSKAIEEIYGSSKALNSSGPSGGENNIRTIDVSLADGTRVKVPYGEIALPDLGDGASIDIKYSTSTNNLHIIGSTEYRHSALIDQVVARTIELLNTNSIYKSQAIELDDNLNPSIMDLSGVEDAYMVLTEQTAQEVKPLMSRIQKPEMCIENGVPLKYGMLLEGSYGTGKTLFAFKMIEKASKNNWVSIYLKDPTKLAEVLRLSKTLDKNGHGVIVFMEDVDQVTRGNRDTAMQDILNTLDGGDTKDMNVISLFTTNHIELIEPTFLRGKRIGSIVSMGPLDAETAESFLVESFKELNIKLDKKGLGDFYKRVAENNIVPAFMAEIVESVKSRMVFEETNLVTALHLNTSLTSYLRQVELSQKKNMDETPEMKLAAALKSVLSNDEILEASRKINEHN